MVNLSGSRILPNRLTKFVLNHYILAWLLYIVCWVQDPLKLRPDEGSTFVSSQTWLPALFCTSEPASEDDEHPVTNFSSWASFACFRGEVSHFIESSDSSFAHFESMIIPSSLYLFWNTEVLFHWAFCFHLKKLVSSFKYDPHSCWYKQVLKKYIWKLLWTS